MAIRNNELGGTDWADDEVVNKTDLNDTMDAMVNKVQSLSAFWLNPNLYDVYDDFESYSVGAITTNTNWTFSSGSWTIASSTVAGGSGKELVNTASSAGNTAVCNTNLLTVNKHTWMRVAITSTKGGDANHGLTLATKLESGAGYTTIATIDGSDNTAYTIYLEVLVIAKGSDVYDIYCGGKKILADYEVTGTFNVFLSYSKGGTATDTYALYIDDVRQSKGTVS